WRRRSASARDLAGRHGVAPWCTERGVSFGTTAWCTSARKHAPAERTHNPDGRSLRGEPDAGNPPVRFDVAGAGDGVMESPKRARSRKRQTQPRGVLHTTAPVPDPTAQQSRLPFSPCLAVCVFGRVLFLPRWLWLPCWQPFRSRSPVMRTKEQIQRRRQPWHILKRLGGCSTCANTARHWRSTRSRTWPNPTPHFCSISASATASLDRTLKRSTSSPSI